VRAAVEMMFSTGVTDETYPNGETESREPRYTFRPSPLGGSTLLQRAHATLGDAERTAAPPAASRRASIRNCRTMRSRSAPSTIRTPTSRRRPREQHVRHVAACIQQQHEDRAGQRVEREAEMLQYSAEAVLESRKQMDAKGLIHWPVRGRVQLAVMRGVIRFVNAVPALKRRMLESMTKLRKVDQVEA